MNLRKIILLLILLNHGCMNEECEYKNQYSLLWGFEDVEVFVLENSNYSDLNNSLLENNFDNSIIFNTTSDSFQPNIPFLFDELTLNENKTARLQIWKSDSILNFSYTQNLNQINLTSNQLDENIELNLNDNCDLLMSTYVVATLNNQPFGVDYLMNLNDTNLSYQDAAKYFANNYNSDLPDTISLFKVTHKEN